MKRRIFTVIFQEEEHLQLAGNKNYVKLFAGAIGLAGLSVIITEVINSLGWIEYRLPPAIPTASILLFYVVHEIFIQRIYQRETLVQTLGSRKIKTWYNIVFGLIGFLCLLSIPLLWWGVIKRLAQSAY